MEISIMGCVGIMEKRMETTTMRYIGCSVFILLCSSFLEVGRTLRPTVRCIYSEGLCGNPVFVIRI